MPKRVLFCLFQAPYDPASGAALATMSVMHILAARPDLFEVRCLSTTSTEAARPDPPLVNLARRGLKASIDTRGAVGRGRAVIRWKDRGVEFVALDTLPAAPLKWDQDPSLSAQFNRLLTKEVTEFKPDIYAAYGGRPNDQLRRQAVWSAGVTVVQMIHNMGYLNTEAFQYTDAVWVPSSFCAAEYRRVAKVDPVHIPPPADRSDVLCANRVAERFLMVNPNSQKGAFVMMRLIDVLRERRPDIPLQVIEGRAIAKDLFAEAKKHGIDLAAHPNLLVTPTVPLSSMVFERAKAIIMPSVWVEPFGKLGAEAMVNGVPALVSGRGGLAESVGLRHDEPAITDIASAAPAGGLVLPVPERLGPRVYTPITVEEAEPWVRAVIRLQDDAAFYRACCEATKAAAALVREDAIHPRYVEFFDGVKRRWKPGGMIP